MADTPAGGAAIQRNLDWLGNWAERNLVKFSKEKYKVLHLTGNNPRHLYMLVTASWEAALQKKKIYGF